jgi:hypothetical protein
MRARAERELAAVREGYLVLRDYVVAQMFRSHRLVL